LTSSPDGCGSPRWSPDGRSIVYDTIDPKGQWDINVIDAAGGEPVPIVRHPADDFAPGFSRDGAWIYFASNRDRQTDIYRVRVTGGDPVRVTDRGGAMAFESIDGKSIYYLKEHLARDVPLFVRALDGTEERRVIESVASRYFAVTKHGVVYTRSADSGGHLDVLVFDPATGRSRALYRNLGPFYGVTSLAVSPDGNTILIGASTQLTADLYLIENFR
jgi:Tol biopolymer transport system component